MKLVVCSRDIDTTLIKGDLISWHEEADYLGDSVSLHAALNKGTYPSAEDYLTKTPFLVVNFPLITYEDIQPIIEEFIYLDNLNIPIDDIAAFSEISQDYTSKRKWKIDISGLETRQANTFYAPQDIAAEKTKWLEVLPPPIRRDTINAYREATLPTTVIADIMVLR